MRKNVWLVLGLGFALVSGRAAMADVWDVQTQNDNTAGRRRTSWFTARISSTTWAR